MNESCQEPVPTLLAGGRGGLFCKLKNKVDGPHDGAHKAHVSIYGVGKVTFQWKTARAQESRPEIELPPPAYVPRG